MESRPESVFSTSPRFTKWAVTMAIYYTNCVFGLCGTFLNPLVLDFSRKFNTTVDQISVVFSIILTCYLLSALIGGFALKYVNRQACALFLIVMLAVPFFGLPHVTNLTDFFMLSSLIGLAQGCYDAAQIAWIIDIWRDESGPFILAQHFAFSVGTLIAPMLVADFLAKKNTTDNSTTNETVTTTERPNFGPGSNTYIPFNIAGGLIVIAFVVQLIMYLVYLCRSDSSSTPLLESTTDSNVSSSSGTNNHDSIVEAGEPSPSRPPTPPPSPADQFRQKVRLVGLSCCVIGFYQGLELCTSQFLPTFTHFSPVHLPEDEGARVLFGLQMGYATGRFIGIMLVLKVPAHFVLTGNLIILFISNVILLVLAGSSTTWLWIGSVLIGVGMSTVYPALYAFVEKYIFVTDSVAGIIAVAGGFVSAIYPLIVGNSVQKHPAVLTYVNFVSIFVCSVAFGVLFWMTEWRVSKRYKKLT